MEIYVKVFTVKEEGVAEWLGAWAPVPAMQVAENQFVITENPFDEEDDYEFYIPGTKVIVTEITLQTGEETFLGAVEVIE